jgi:prepilin-type N-terminal cleavage/methylation domain-containing protein
VFADVRPGARNLSARLAREQGFTLIEALVALAAGAIVMVALVTIMNVTLDQSEDSFSRLDATEGARVKLEQIVNELHSACIGNGVPPVQAGSTATQLIFLSQYGNAASVTPVEHVITLSSGTLTDATYAETSETPGIPPTYTFASTPTSTTTLLTNVSAAGSTPVFQYFPYGTVSNGSGGVYADPDGNDYEVLLDGVSDVPNQTPAVVAPADDLVTTAAPSLSATNAATVAEVEVTLSVGPSLDPQESTQLADAPLTDGSLTVQDSAVFRLTDPANHVGTGAVFTPCD